MICLCFSAVARAEVTQSAWSQPSGPHSKGAASNPSARPRKPPRATIAVDPDDFHGAVIADIGLAPRNAMSLGEAAAEAAILRVAGGGNGTLLREVPNRGRKLMLMLFDERLIVSQCVV